jgi:hypothetical protein
MEAGLLGEDCCKTLSSLKTIVNSMSHACWSSSGKCLSAEHNQVSAGSGVSNNQDHADGNVECRGIAASKAVVGDDSNVILFKCSSPVMAIIVDHLLISSPLPMVQLPEQPRNAVLLGPHVNTGLCDSNSKGCSYQEISTELAYGVVAQGSHACPVHRPRQIQNRWLRSDKVQCGPLLPNTPHLSKDVQSACVQVVQGL